MDSCICQTSTASPAEPGGLPTDWELLPIRFSPADGFRVLVPIPVTHPVREPLNNHNNHIGE